jgi:hypothetical protein
VLVERQQDERAKAVDEETAGGHPAVEPSLEVGSRLLTIQSGESPRAAGEQRGPPFQESQGDRQAETHEAREARQRAVDLEQNVFVDGLIEAVAARAERIDDGGQDGRRARG